MAALTNQTGVETFNLLKDIFKITDSGVRKITLVAEVDSLTTINVEMFARLNEVDITSTEINKDDVFDSHTYEVTVKRVIKE
tara:strand:+ start:330 stop:575 length:246 start_codon:yes stop_codon:yes gene_type:complete